MLCIDLIGKYRMTPNKRDRKYAMKGEKDKDVCLHAIAMIDPAAYWLDRSMFCASGQSRPSC